MTKAPPPPPGRRFDSRKRCGCGDLATVRIEFFNGDVRWYCYPCS